jgi:uncharacterized protein YkwD
VRYEEYVRYVRKPLRQFALVATAAALVALCVSASGGAAAARDGPTGAAGAAARTASPLEDQIVAAINAFRASQGAPPLADSPVLTALAAAHSQEMLTLGYFGHDSPGGETALQRLSAFFNGEGYDNLPVGENIALAPGTGDATTFLQSWLGDPEHRAILLGTGQGPLYANVGVGVATADSAPGVYAGQGQVSVVTAVFGPPQPVYGQSALVAPVDGIVLVKPPSATTFSPLTDIQLIDSATQLDTTKGRVRLTSVADDHGAIQTADFYQGRFAVTYAPDFPAVSPNLVTNLQLSGALTGCSPAVVPRRLSGPVKQRPRAKPKPTGPTTRALWGSGKGSFRTQGAYAAATVRGTVWFTQDSCAATLVRVQTGVVDVFDIKRNTHVSVPAGQSVVIPK